MLKLRSRLCFHNFKRGSTFESTKYLHMRHIVHIFQQGLRITFSRSAFTFLARPGERNMATVSNTEGGDSERLEEKENGRNEKQIDLGEVNIVSEGKAQVLFPKSVFYNPVQEFNRDLTIQVIKHFTKKYIHNKQEKEKKKAEKQADSSMADPEKSSLPYIDVENLKPGEHYERGVKILEGLAASGLRSMRFALEIPGVQKIVANDFDANAVEFIKQNIAKNKVGHIVDLSCNDASMAMYSNRRFSSRYDVIDLDPYGSPSKFLDAAVQAVADDGLLCITCTDMAVMCGNGVEAGFAKYGSMSLKAKFCHEMALRIILNSIETHANRYSRYITPMLSISADFYIRVFVKVNTGQGIVKKSIAKRSMVYHCVGCGTYKLQPIGKLTPTGKDGLNFRYTPAQGPPTGPTCEHCGSRHNLGGPIWSEPIHDQQFVDELIENLTKAEEKPNTHERILGVLSMVSEELSDVPLHYTSDGLCSIIHCTSPDSMQFRSAILNAGYRVSFTHTAKNSIKTDAPAHVLWDILREWVKENPVSSKRLTEGSVVKNLLDKEITTKNISFELHPDANPASRQSKLLRWQQNPTKDWGPKPRAKQSGKDDNVAEKRERMQNKRKEMKAVDERDLKQYPCKRYKVGDCEHGDACTYTHDDNTGISKN
ncbi:unnamed protein product [Owenia fusiformis]|uniref:tRNA (guanine(26)-N(2))-dimethyltransferase n=1 Tax=Owenia fusiformis TaxID=6347 RepID=A0A8J1TUU2_OWEFU|nr:unnamed protein product [Owenia fusiformis]